MKDLSRLKEVEKLPTVTKKNRNGNEVTEAIDTIGDDLDGQTVTNQLVTDEKPALDKYFDKCRFEGNLPGILLRTKNMRIAVVKSIPSDS